MTTPRRPESCSYEELLEQVKKLTDETLALQKEITPCLFIGDTNENQDINQNYSSLSVVKKSKTIIFFFVYVLYM